MLTHLYVCGYMYIYWMHICMLYFTVLLRQNFDWVSVTLFWTTGWGGRAEDAAVCVPVRFGSEIQKLHGYAYTWKGQRIWWFEFTCSFPNVGYLTCCGFMSKIRFWLIHFDFRTNLCLCFSKLEYRQQNIKMYSIWFVYFVSLCWR